MAVFEFAIATKDKDGTRSKTGDIIAYKPHPWQWSDHELRNYLIVVIGGITEEQAAALCSPDYEGGKIAGKFTAEESPAIVNKRRFNIPLDSIAKAIKADVSLSDLRDSRKIYQPAKATILSLDDNIVYDKALKKKKQDVSKIN